MKYTIKIFFKKLKILVIVKFLVLTIIFIIFSPELKAQEFTYPPVPVAGWKYSETPFNIIDYGKTGLILRQGCLEVKTTGYFLDKEKWSALLESFFEKYISEDIKIPDTLFLRVKVDILFDNNINFSYIGYGFQNKYDEFLASGALLKNNNSWQELKIPIKNILERAGGWSEMTFNRLYLKTGVEGAIENKGKIFSWSFWLDEVSIIDTMGVKTILDDFGGPVVSVEKEIQTPTGFVLDQNYPNPFNPTTKISFFVPKSDTYSLRVYNLLGQEIAILVSSHLQAGYHSVDFDAEKLPSGVYIYRLEGENISLSKKMIYIK